MTKHNHDIITISAVLKHQTEKAVLIHDGMKDVWLPKSKIEVSETGKGGVVEVDLPEWLAYEKELI